MAKVIICDARGSAGGCGERAKYRLEDVDPYTLVGTIADKLIT